MQTLNELIPAGARKFVYLAFAVVGAALTAATVGYAELDLTSPDWLRVAGAVYYSLGASFGLLAAHNILKKDKGEPEPEEDEDFSQEAWDAYLASLIPAAEPRRAEADDADVIPADPEPGPLS